MTRKKFSKPRKPLSTKSTIIITIAFNLALAGAIYFIPITINIVNAFWNAPAKSCQSTVSAPYSDALEKAFAALKSSKQPKANILPKQKSS